MEKYRGDYDRRSAGAHISILYQIQNSAKNRLILPPYRRRSFNTFSKDNNDIERCEKPKINLFKQKKKEEKWNKKVACQMPFFYLDNSPYVIPLKKQGSTISLINVFFFLQLFST